MIVCNEKEASWTQITFHCKARFGTVKMPTKLLKTWICIQHWIIDR